MIDDRRALVISRIASTPSGIDRDALRAAYLDDTPRGVTPLMRAIASGSSIGELADVDAIAEGAMSALVLAVSRCDEGIVERLLAAGADADMPTLGERTPLHLAAEAGSLALVERLLAAGARVVRDARGRSPLVTAIVHDAMPVFARLLAIAVDDRDCAPAVRAACAHDRVEMLRTLTARFGDTIATGSEPLQIAAEHGALAVVRFLLDAGAPIDAFDLKEERSALMHAVSGGHHAVAELLLARGANPNAQTEWFVTALRIAVRRGDERMIALLRAHGAREDGEDGSIDVVLPYAHYTSAIAPHAREASDVQNAIATDDVVALSAMIASTSPNKHALAELLAHSASANAWHTTAYVLACGAEPRSDALLRAIRAGATRAVRLVLAACALPLADDVTIAAVSQPDPWLLADVLARGAPAHARQYGTTALEVATRAGYGRHVELLVAHGASLDAPALLKMAAASGNVRCIEVLVAHDRTSLDAALLAAAAHPRAIEALVRPGANPGTRDANGDSLLHLGAREKTAIDVHLRLAGQFVRAGGAHGRTPLHAAALGGTPATIAALVAAGADVDARDEDGATALHLACTYPRPGIAHALLAGGASHAVHDDEGSTPLHVAVAHPETVRELLAAGADRTARDSLQRTPRERAEAELAALTHWTFRERPARERALALLVSPV